MSDQGVGRAAGLLGFFEGEESRGGGVGVTQGVEAWEGKWCGGWWCGWDAECGETEKEIDVGGVLGV